MGTCVCVLVSCCLFTSLFSSYDTSCPITPFPLFFLSFSALFEHMWDSSSILREVQTSSLLVGSGVCEQMKLGDRWQIIDRSIGWLWRGSRVLLAWKPVARQTRRDCQCEVSVCLRKRERMRVKKCWVMSEQQYAPGSQRYCFHSSYLWPHPLCACVCICPGVFVSIPINPDIHS